ncbi:N-alpha-acetyltransferase 80 [Nematostella vectensis]|uniref:N-alpha-acetyltransferase 80 n=1 Tax=Nematostella vectensis TaxID=45351 RepID=UPI002077737B|nr:N-alpha-acetyltransferase 80 [Nematostella vectensis]
MDKSKEETDFLKLHENVTFAEEVVNLLSSEWPRSKAARYHSLNLSNDNFPCAMVLVRRDPRCHSTEVVGHCVFSKVHGSEDALFIENVIVPKSKRGCGYGRLLMQRSESFAQNLGYHKLHLSTHDKYKFYHCLGYQDSHPVSAIRPNHTLLSPAQFAALRKHLGEKNTKTDNSIKKATLKDLPNTPSQTLATTPTAPMVTNPAPPPPPPPPLIPSNTSAEASDDKKYWMVKEF